jgi:threonine dehydrogenase-like Zn-dependent dehydrogenase
MKQAAILAPRQAVLIDTADLSPKDDWVVVKVHAAPMCTEYKSFLSGEPTARLGHEAAGEVVAVARPGRLKVGDRVVAMPL